MVRNRPAIETGTRMQACATSLGRLATPPSCLLSTCARRQQQHASTDSACLRQCQDPPPFVMAYASDTRTRRLHEISLLQHNRPPVVLHNSTRFNPGHRSVLRWPQAAPSITAGPFYSVPA